MFGKRIKLLIATGNPGKVVEITRLIGDAPVTLKTLRDFPNIKEVAETGSTFEENAILKAKGYSFQSGLWTLADDSGLEIEALNSAPGIHSGRYASDKMDYNEKMSLLLGELDRTGDTRRSARFVCSMALANGRGEIVLTSAGICEGKIAKTPRGTNGFGYDPIFMPAGFAETLGELSDEIKQHISHRARASLKIMRYLLGFIAV